LIDDELYASWARFAAGVRILVLSDSCHSGTVTRAVSLPTRRAKRLLTAMQRGTEERIVTRELPLGVEFRTYFRHRADYDEIQDQLVGVEQTAVAASILLISGYMDDDRSEEDKYNGRFTAVLEAAWDSGRFAGTYLDFREDIRRRLRPRQQPNLFKAGVEDRAFERQKPFTI
jgi:hypothetical protein